MINKQLITIIIFCGISFAVIRLLLESFFPGGLSLGMNLIERKCGKKFNQVVMNFNPF